MCRHEVPEEYPNRFARPAEGLDYAEDILHDRVAQGSLPLPVAHVSQNESQEAPA